MLLAATETQRRESTEEAFRSAPTNEELRSILAKSDYAISGWRGNWQMNDADREWFAANFVCVAPVGETCIARRMPGAGDALVVADDEVRFGSGWFDEEHDASSRWRWMGRRGEIVIPPSRARRRLVLTLSSPRATDVAISIDGSSAAAFGLSAERSVAIDITPSSHDRRIVLSSSRAFRPSDEGSKDTRELGLRLSRLVYLAR